MKFPKMKDGQFALVVAESATGHVLDVTGQLYSNQRSIGYYHVYDSLYDALTFVKKRIAENNAIEFTLYDKNQKLVQYFYNEHAKALFLTSND